jgi:hypothetical protein
MKDLEMSDEKGGPPLAVLPGMKAKGRLLTE